MLLVGALLVAAVNVRGDLDVRLDAATYPDQADGVVLELTYDITYASLAFVRGDSSFQAEFEIALQVLDRGGNPLAGDAWRVRQSVMEYDETVSRESRLTGAVELVLPGGAYSAAVAVADAMSARRAVAEFRLESPSRGIRLRFLRGGAVHPGRTYGLTDTITAQAELLDPAAAVDSFRFSVFAGNRIVDDSSRAVVDSAGRRTARYSMAIADSAGVARLSSGEYRLEVVGVGTGLLPEARAGFSVRVPFFYDDEAYFAKVDELVHVATAAEMGELKRMPPREREQRWHDFWKGRDPTPTTDRNEREEEYFERIDYAKEHFGHGDRGFRSDRARVYVRYGPPDNVEARPFEIDTRAYEIWYYYGLGYEFVFVDRSGFGVYTLESPRFLDER